MADKRIPQLLPQPDAYGNLMFAVYDPATDTTRSLTLSQFVGGYDNNTLLWDAIAVYAENDVVLSDDKFWKSLVNGNAGNLPQEDANWAEVSKSLGSGIALYEVGLYTENPTVVLSNHSGIWQLYKLVSATPYVSADIQAEEIAGVWEPIPFITALRSTTIGAGLLPLDFKNGIEYLFASTNPIAANVAIQYLNAAKGRSFKLKVEITAETSELTFPNTTLMADNRWVSGTKKWRASDVADPDTQGYYIFEGWYDGATWNVKGSGPYK